MRKGNERILVIDDSEVVLTRIRMGLAAATDYELVTSTQTVGAARHLRGCALVIVDYYMPGLDGGTVMRSLRAALPAGEVAPAFYLYTTDEKISASYQALGFDGCFTRKGDMGALVEQVQAAIRIQKLRRMKQAKTGDV